MVNPTRGILITNERNSYSAIKDWCSKRGIPFSQKSFIKTVGVPHLNIPSSDWIFFSSPNSISTYLAHYSINAKKIAVYGEGSEREALKHGLNIDFVGPIENNPKTIAQFFDNDPGSTIFFPLSQRSKRSIIKEIGKATVFELETYKTIIQPSLVQSHEVLIFTSPSNLEGFLVLNKISDNQTLIAYGRTTEAALLSLNLSNTIITLKTSTELELEKVIRKLF
ncbi:uroporphyrinogen-III synthase [Crocinitomix algicola]|uniref:uroporphyrinogen-III synthase n=1 Tax=Crocinitomix algicola TaxID=1740263 RepID=UPI00082F0C5E|nr:uroporphyrinogen-III synthase [Crocinitomix algicola]